MSSVPSFVARLRIPLQITHSDVYWLLYKDAAYSHWVTWCETTQLIKESVGLAVCELGRGSRRHNYDIRRELGEAVGVALHLFPSDQFTQSWLRFRRQVCEDQRTGPNLDYTRLMAVFLIRLRQLGNAVIKKPGWINYREGLVVKQDPSVIKMLIRPVVANPLNDYELCYTHHH